MHESFQLFTKLVRENFVVNFDKDSKNWIEISRKKEYVRPLSWIDMFS